MPQALHKRGKTSVIGISFVIGKRRGGAQRAETLESGGGKSWLIKVRRHRFSFG